MPEIIAQFPIPSRQQIVSGGQIFAINFPPQQLTVPVKELALVMKAPDLTARQIQILEELAVYQHATADLLLRRLRLSPNSLRYLQKQIYALYDPDKPEDRYVDFLYPPKHNPSRFGGSAPYVVTLGPKGFAFLRKRGVDIGRYRNSTSWVHEPFPLRHRLAVNEFLLKAQLLETEQTPEVQDTQVTLLKFLHEKYWNANPLKVQPSDAEKSQGLSPDLLLAFATQQPRELYWMLPEINLSEPWRKDWEAKVRLYRYCMPAYQERLGTRLLTTIPVMIASSSAFPRQVYAKETGEDRIERRREAQRRFRRMQTLLKWTENVLNRLNMRAEADLFSFSYAPHDVLSPTELFFSPIWIHPF